VKALTVLIRAEMEVPDDWELVEHPSGMQVLKIGNQYVDFDIAPLATESADPNAEWSDENAHTVDKVLDAVVGMDVLLEIQRQQ